MIQTKSFQIKPLLLLRMAVVLCVFLVSFVPHAFAQRMDYSDSATYVYVLRGKDSMHLNMYHAINPRPDNITVVYLFSGAFIMGDRNDKQTRLDVNALLKAGFNVASIDYRKYFANVDVHSYPKGKLLNLLDSALFTASADCSAAIAYLVSNAKKLRIDPSRIVLSGSSAGAMTVLQTEFGRCNNSYYTTELPSSFRPLAIFSYAGAVFNHNGEILYDTPPAPTAFFYGSIDRVVPYRAMQLLNARYAGSEGLTSIYEDSNYVFWTYRYLGHGHEVAGYLHRTIPELVSFIDIVMAERHVHYHTDAKADEFMISFFSKLTFFDLFKKDAKLDGRFEENKESKH